MRFLHFQFNSAEKVGLYKVFGDSEREIHITKKAKFDLNQILAILIHESIHNYLDYYKIKKEVEYDNEILTDLTAVYLGFGKYLLNGYKTIEYPILNGTRYTQIGYIKYKDIIKAMNYSALKRNIVEIAHSLTLGQKLKIKKEINKRKNHLLIKEKINMILKKINILYNSYNECTIMFKRLSSEKIQKSFSDQESKILYTFAQMLSTQKIIVKLNLLKKELDNEENHRIKNINQIELKVNSIEDRISKWYYLLKDY